MGKSTNPSFGVSAGLDASLAFSSNQTGDYPVSAGVYATAKSGDGWFARGPSRRVRVVPIVQGASGEAIGVRIARQYSVDATTHVVETSDYLATAGGLAGEDGSSVGTGDRPAVSLTAVSAPDGSTEVFSPGAGNGIAWVTEDLHGCDRYAVFTSVSTGAGFTADGGNAIVGTEE